MTFSATRVSTWLNCQRKAGWEYLCGYEAPQTGATDLGVEVHGILEKVKAQGAELDCTTDAGLIAAEALPFVEGLTPENGAEFEDHFKIQGRHLWQGFKDVRWSCASHAEVVDYKTTGDFRYAKTADDLLVDPQALLYAEDEFRRGATHVQLMWLYLKKRRSFQARPVRVEVTREHAAKGFECLEQLADEFQAAADASPEAPHERHLYVLNSLEPNEDHCSAYGGCPHSARCTDLGFFRDPTKKGKTMNMLERLQAMGALGGGTANDTPPPPAPGPVVHAAGSAAAMPALPPGWKYVQQANGSWIPTPEDTTAPAHVGGDRFTDAFANPPTDAAPAETVAEIVASTPAAEVAPGQINPPKRGPGRPRKTPAPAPVNVHVNVSAPSPETVAAIAALPSTPPVSPTQTYPDLTPKPATEHRIGTLYVGCIPRGIVGELPDFDKIIAKAKVAVGPQDWRMVEYGKGNALLLDMFKGIVQHEKPNAMLVLDSPEATLCLSYLRSISDCVIEGVR